MKKNIFQTKKTIFMKFKVSGECKSTGIKWWAFWIFDLISFHQYSRQPAVNKFSYSRRTVKYFEFLKIFYTEPCPNLKSQVFSTSDKNYRRSHINTKIRSYFRFNRTYITNKNGASDAFCTCPQNFMNIEHFVKKIFSWFHTPACSCENWMCL